MLKIITLFFIFFKIGAFSFGGGYAMLPFIQQEFIDKYHFITNQEFLDLVALSQSTPGPIAINCATFIGYRVAGVIGSISSTIGVIIFSVIGLSIISKLFNQFKDNNKIKNLLITLRPITLGFILSSAFSSALGVSWDLYSIIAFITSFYFIYTKKIDSISVVFIYGVIGILIFYV